MLYWCVGIGTDNPDHVADGAQPDGFYDGHVEQGLKGQSDAIKHSPQNQPPRPLQMNVGAGNHPFPKSFLDGDFEFVSCYILGFKMTELVYIVWPKVSKRRSSNIENLKPKSTTKIIVFYTKTEESHLKRSALSGVCSYLLYSCKVACWIYTRVILVWWLAPM